MPPLTRKSCPGALTRSEKADPRLYAVNSDKKSTYGKSRRAPSCLRSIVTTTRVEIHKPVSLEPSAITSENAGRTHKGDNFRHASEKAAPGSSNEERPLKSPVHGFLPCMAQLATGLQPQIPGIASTPRCGEQPDPRGTLRPAPLPCRAKRRRRQSKN